MKFSRHTCRKCKTKKHEFKMFMIGTDSRSGANVWLCRRCNDSTTPGDDLPGKSTQRIKGSTVLWFQCPLQIERFFTIGGYYDPPIVFSVHDQNPPKHGKKR